jgi:hypothetical protein
MDSFLGLAVLAALIVATAEWVRHRLKDRESVPAGENSEKGKNG